MRRILGTVTMAALALSLPAAAFAQNGHSRDNLQLQGFGGFTVREISPSTTFGGSIAVPLTDNIHLIGEGGRMTDIMSPTISTLLDFADVDVRLSALYGEGGVRFVGGSDRAVRPYAEATAGMARMRTSVVGITDGVDSWLNTGLRFLDSTKPVLGVGGGVLIQGGPMLIDLGYRYHKISGGNFVQSALTGGDFNVHQMRLGLGVRF